MKNDTFIHLEESWTLTEWNNHLEWLVNNLVEFRKLLKLQQDI